MALFITQTGGGCRASNYIHLLRKALEKADLAFVPVISVNLSGLEKNPGFSLTLPIIRKMVYAMMYGTSSSMWPTRSGPMSGSGAPLTPWSPPGRAG